MKLKARRRKIPSHAFIQTFFVPNHSLHCIDITHSSLFSSSLRFSPFCLSWLFVRLLWSCCCSLFNPRHSISSYLHPYSFRLPFLMCPSVSLLFSSLSSHHPSARPEDSGLLALAIETREQSNRRRRADRTTTTIIIATVCHNIDDNRNNNNFFINSATTMIALPQGSAATIAICPLACVFDRFMQS